MLNSSVVIYSADMLAPLEAVYIFRMICDEIFFVPSRTKFRKLVS